MDGELDRMATASSFACDLTMFIRQSYILKQLSRKYINIA